MRTRLGSYPLVDRNAWKLDQISDRAKDSVVSCALWHVVPCVKLFLSNCFNLVPDLMFVTQYTLCSCLRLAELTSKRNLIWANFLSQYTLWASGNSPSCTAVNSLYIWNVFYSLCFYYGSVIKREPSRSCKDIRCCKNYKCKWLQKLSDCKQLRMLPCSALCLSCSMDSVKYVTEVVDWLNGYYLFNSLNAFMHATETVTCRTHMQR